MVDAEWVAAAFGLRGDVRLTVVGRGAKGRLSRLDAGPAAYALKELFREPDLAVVTAEATATAVFADAGVRLPRCLPAVDGRFVVTPPDGGWLRLYEWADGGPADPARDAERLGRTLGLLHAAAPPSDGPRDLWFETTPDAADWAAVGLGAHAAAFTALARLVRPVDPARQRVCHRDLHPENTLLSSDGELVVLDWEDVGPADPDRELGMVLARWHVRGDQVDAAAVRRTLDAYRAAGGTGWPRDESAFAMAVTADQNYLLRQARVAADPASTPEELAWAGKEIAESMEFMITRPAVDELLEISARAFAAR
ncbi:MAG TPA: aminoglycoside phosphotransferase family protein [Pseudonocardiaceae bacterium]